MQIWAILCVCSHACLGLWVHAQNFHLTSKFTHIDINVCISLSGCVLCILMRTYELVSDHKMSHVCLSLHLW